jgi:hypothetical protein
MSIGCLTVAFLTAVVAACAVVIVMAAVQKINRGRADTSDIASTLEKLEAAHTELRLLSPKEEADLRSIIDRLQDAILTLQLQR